MYESTLASASRSSPPRTFARRSFIACRNRPRLSKLSMYSSMTAGFHSAMGVPARMVMRSFTFGGGM